MEIFASIKKKLEEKKTKSRVKILEEAITRFSSRFFLEIFNLEDLKYRGSKYSLEERNIINCIAKSRGKGKDFKKYKRVLMSLL